ncbi:MAG: DinB family protein [Dehalococcoidia bacterium]|nr:DinB family protein [Dehalococcoidia bacterium]
MTDEFEADLRTAREQLDTSREGLLKVVGALSDADLDRGRRGGWPVRRVLEHVIQSEWLYSRVVTHLRGLPVEGDLVSGAPTSVPDALDRLGAARRALLQAAEDVDEEAFYQLQTVGHEEYSILTVLENTALHDREHADQVQEILERT